MKWKLSILRPSTRAFLREAQQTPGYSWFDFLHGYVYGRWPYFYIAVGTGQHPLSKFLAGLAAPLILLFARKSKTAEQVPAGEAFANTYHGKVIPTETARQFVSVREEIRVNNAETVIPYDRARDIILKNPEHIVVLDCPCRAARPNPCLPLDVCLIIGEPFASFVTEHQPARSRRISSEEAQAILKAENERGHVHHAFFKDAMLNRFYAICNCCSCCCGAIQAHQSGTPMLASSGYLAQVKDELCLGCGNCVEFCQFEALQIGESGVMSVDKNRCMGCGVCISHCTEEAISLQLAPEKGEPLQIPS